MRTNVIKSKLRLKIEIQTNNEKKTTNMGKFKVSSKKKKAHTRTIIKIYKIR